MLMYTKVWQPQSVAEAYEMMSKQKMAPLLAGGCWLRLGKRRAAAVIDLSGLGLQYIKESDEAYAIGAMTTQGEVERYKPFQTLANGLLCEAVRPILGVQFRNMATMGGSVAGRFGFSDILPALLALHAEVVTYQGGRMSLEDYMSYRERDLLLEVRVPKKQVPVAMEALRKSASDFPYLTGSIRKDGTGYEIFIGCRPQAPVKAIRASEILSTKGSEALPEAIVALEEELSFQTTSSASKEYRKAMAKRMTTRLVREVEAWK